MGAANGQGVISQAAGQGGQGSFGMGGGYQAPTTQPYTPQYTQSYRFSAPAPSNMVNRAYGDLFGRSPDMGGANYWGGQLAGGMAPSQMMRNMSASPEFQAQQDYSRGYTSVFRPGYKEFGPNGQYYQPIYQSSYVNYASPTYGGYGGILGNLGGYGTMGGGGMPNPMGYGMGGIFGGNYGGYGGGMGGFGGMGFEEGGEVASDDGIAALLNK